MPYKNNWIPSKTLEEMSKTNYDVLIVGTGPGGGATLYRLCQLWKYQRAKSVLIHLLQLQINTVKYTEFQVCLSAIIALSLP
ncbi:hypothetical protein DES36_10943 [Alkalibaculum bacchi]|uniref:Uncharacterized protein n=1 Tax=Alkalibaculum bacchi TaxID=645887 RepID=A0A366I852_9FIRM|nr:hypothetical protein DES36_10943 [Alkalibaculum bacchi]